MSYIIRPSRLEDLTLDVNSWDVGVLEAYINHPGPQYFHPQFRFNKLRPAALLCSFLNGGQPVSEYNPDTGELAQFDENWVILQGGEIL